MNHIPSVSHAALNAIADDNTRSVLKNLVNGWEARNNGNARFLTEEEVLGNPKLKSAMRQSAADALKNLNLADVLSPGNLNRVMSDLHTQVMGSKLFRDLDHRIDLIDKPNGLFDTLNTVLKNEITQRETESAAFTEQFAAMGVRMNAAETAIVTEVTQRVNAIQAITQTVMTQYAAVNDSLALLQQSLTTAANAIAALVTQTTTLQAVLNDHSAAISQEWEARVNLQNDFYASYTLRVDVNGYVSGFGLASSGSVSQFMVLADVFSLVSPSGNRAALIMQPHQMNIFDEAGNLRTRVGRLD